MSVLLDAIGPPLLVARGPDGRVIAPPGAAPLTARLRLGLIGALLAAIMSLLSTRLTSFGVADLRGAVGTDLDISGWLTAAFSVGNIAIVPATPLLAGLFSVRRVMIVCIMLLAMSSLAIALVPPYAVLVVLRFLQGVGAGALLPLLLMAVLALVPAVQRIWGIALYAAITTLSPTVAESIAGVLTDDVSWKAMFWLVAGMAPVAIFLVRIGLPATPVDLSRARGTDYAALVYSIAGFGALTAALTQGQDYDWFDSGVIDGLFAIAAICIVAFVVNEVTCARPLMNMRLFLRLNFSLALIVLLAFNFAMLGAFYVLPQFATVVKGWRELQIGQVLLWLAVPQLVLTPLSCWLLRYVDNRILLACGMFTFTIGSYMATGITSDWGVADLLPSQIVQACALPFIMPPLLQTVAATITPADAASVGGLFNIVRVLAGTLGTAVAGGVITVRERLHSALILLNVPPGAATAASAGGISARASGQAYVMAFADTFGMLGLIALACLILVPLLRPSPIARPVRGRSGV